MYGLILNQWLVFGAIKLRDYKNNENRTWPVDSDCESVRIRSTMMKTENKKDYVKVGETQYSGTVRIDAILSSNFTVTFISNKLRTDKGFNLNWNCLKWTEWTPIGRGTCLERTKPQPEYHGKDVKKHTKYRDLNGTCGKLFFLHFNYSPWKMENIFKINTFQYYLFSNVLSWRFFQTLLYDSYSMKLLYVYKYILLQTLVLETIIGVPHIALAFGCNRSTHDLNWMSFHNLINWIIFKWKQVST